MYKNIEGYPDPTAGTAIMRVSKREKKRKRKNRKHGAKNDTTRKNEKCISSGHTGSTV